MMEMGMNTRRRLEGRLEKLPPPPLSLMFNFLYYCGYMGQPSAGLAGCTYIQSKTLFIAIGPFPHRILFTRSSA